MTWLMFTQVYLDGATPRFVSLNPSPSVLTPPLDVISQVSLDYYYLFNCVFSSFVSVFDV